MKKNIIFSLLMITSLFACNNLKTIQQNVYAGQYDHAIDLALAKIKKKKGKKSADPYIKFLKLAYDKAVEKDLAQIHKLNIDDNPAKWRQIYETYLKLDLRQEKIKPVLPLYLSENHQPVKFNLTDYSPALKDAKNHLAAHLYHRAKTLLNRPDKSDIRKAYEVFNELDRIAPGYKDVKQLMKTAHRRGMTYALVKIDNQTDKIIPRRLQDELLNFSSYGANNFWVNYDAQKQPNTSYDYLINLKFTGINLSPDQEREKEIIEEKEIQDGYTYQKDAAGNIVKDSLGHAIKIPRMIKVYSKLRLFQQYKSANLQAIVEVKDLHSGQLLDAFPLQSKYIFDHHYATYTGDRRAIDKEYLDFLQQRRMAFPSSEQMIYDAAREIKDKFKDILYQADFL